MSERPLSSDFERHLVLSIIYSPRFREFIFGKVKGSWLKFPEYRYIYETVEKLHRHDKPITFLSVCEAIRKDYKLADGKYEEYTGKINQYISNPDPDFMESCIQSVLGSVQEEVGKNLLTSALAKSTYLLEQGEPDKIFELFNKIEKEAIFVQPERVYAWEELRKIRKDDAIIKRGIPLGIRGENDQMIMEYFDQSTIYKGLGRGQLALLMGLSSAGKTSLMTNIAVHQALLGYNVDFYSLEMAYDYIILTMMSMLLNIPRNELHGKIEDHMWLLDEILQNYPKNKDIRVYHPQGMKLTTSMIGHDLELSMKEGRKTDVLFIDYADLMRPSRKFRETYEELLHIIIELRALGDEYDCAVVTCCQANRPPKEGKNKRLTRDRQAGAYGRIFPSDVFITINKEEEKVKDVMGNVKDVNNIYLFVDKNRFGKVGFTMRMEADMTTGRFFDPFPPKEIEE